jgi:hypothetical protein
VTVAQHLARVRKICLSHAGATEKLSHGEPTFFLKQGVFTMFANNHHHDGKIAVWIPAAPGMQQAMIEDAPEKFFRPPYVGPSGWVGVVLDHATDVELAELIRQAAKFIAAKKKKR